MAKTGLDLPMPKVLSTSHDRSYLIREDAREERQVPVRSLRARN
jgi:hypothetical protein